MHRHALSLSCLVLLVALAACSITITAPPTAVFVCLVNGDTLVLDRADTTGVRCAPLDSLVNRR